MAVSFLAASALQVVEDSDGSPRNFTLSVGGTTRGILVLATSDGSSADRISAISYGGQSLTRVESVADTAGEPGRVYAYFLGTGVPTGSNTLAVAHTTGSFKDLVLFSLAGDADLEVADFGSLFQNQASPRVTLTPDREAVAACCIFSGLGAVGNLSLLTGMSTVASFDGGAWVLRFDRQTSVSASPFQIGYTSSSDDVAFVAVSVQEMAAAPPNDGTASGAIGWVGVVTGITLRVGSSSGAVGWAGSVLGVSIHAGSASGAISWVGSADGEAPAVPIPQGSVSGSVDWVGTTLGTTERAGEATGSVLWVGTVAGATTHQGTVSGSVDWPGASAGATSSEGSSTGAVTWVGSASGVTPTVGAQEGSATGSIAWTGTALGAASQLGSVLGAVDWAGTAAGESAYQGAAVGAVSWVGTAHGDSGDFYQLTVIPGMLGTRYLVPGPGVEWSAARLGGRWIPGRLRL